MIVLMMCCMLFGKYVWLLVYLMMSIGWMIEGVVLVSDVLDDSVDYVDS